jgi:hypothetical protein
LGWRPTTPEREDDDEIPELKELDLTQEWSEPEYLMPGMQSVFGRVIEWLGVIPSIGRGPRGDMEAGEIQLVPSTSQIVDECTTQYSLSICLREIHRRFFFS